MVFGKAGFLNCWLKKNGIFLLVKQSILKTLLILSGRVLESAAASDTVLKFEKELSAFIPARSEICL